MTREGDLAERRARLSEAKRRLLEERLKGAASAIPEPSIPLRPDRTTAPLSHAQEWLWFIHQIEPGSPAYNQTVALHLSGALNVPALERTNFSMR